MNSNRVIHFEIQADDIERAKKFYQDALGWKIKKAMSKDEGGMMDYWTIETGTGPGINGGLYERPKDEKEKYYVYDCTVMVQDLDQATRAVKAAGGRITHEKSEIKDVGYFAGAIDTEGNKFGLMQPTKWQPMT